MSLPQILSQLSGGMVRTVGIFFLTLIFSLPLGLVISFGRMAKNPVLKNLFKIYISVMRGTPLMLQLMVFYFGPYYLFKMNIGGNWRFTAIILSFSLNYATMRLILRRSIVPALSPCRWASTRRRSFWATAEARPFSGSFSHRW